MLQQQGPLAQIVDQQRRHGHAEPGLANGAFAKVAQVGVQGLGARHAEHHGTQQQKGGTGFFGNESQRIVGTECPQNLGQLHDVPDAQRGQTQEPQQHDGPKPAPNPRRATLLHGKQHEQDAQRQRQNG